MSNEADAIWAKIRAIEDDPQYPVNIRNTRNPKEIREELIRLPHYYHLLLDLGDKRSNNNKLRKSLSVANSQISEEACGKSYLSEFAEVRLVTGHIRSWTVAMYYYERAQKNLSRMVISLMDAILQTHGDASIVYEGKDQSSYAPLWVEIESLSRSYMRCGCYLSVFDYCSGKAADYLGMPEYRTTNHAHEDIVADGMPDMVRTAVLRLQQATGDQQEDILRVFVPAPVYDPDALETAYQQAVKFYRSETRSMTFFPGLVDHANAAYTQVILKRLEDTIWQKKKFGK